MLPIRWAVALCAAVVPLIGSAQGSRAISGTIYDDRAALAVRANFVPAAGVTVKLYRDGGDRLPSADDAIMATETTSARGAYAFPPMSAGDYWVAVDSRTVRAGKSSASTAWAEQTFGPSGSLCARQSGIPQATYFEGSCIGGRTVASDDASSLPTSEHVALVSSSDANVDFAFSFNVVTSAVDGDRLQGSFRQFLTNADAVTGPNAMRFVPLTPAPEQRQPIMGVPTQWWSIALSTPLPELQDDDTVIDGTAYNLISPASVLQVHPGRLGETATVRPLDRAVPLIEKPELELLLSGENGIVCAKRCGIRALSLHGSPAGVVTRGDARIEQVLIGASPDGVAAEAGTVGLQVEKGVANVQHVLVTNQTRAGLLVGAEGRLDGQHLEISRCGDPQTGGGIILLSDGSAVRNSIIAANPGAGIIVGALDGKPPANGNTIESSAISSNQAGVILGPGSSRNIVARNDIMWNRLGGVTSAPFETAPPTQNRLSANRFDENGLRPIILNLATENPNELSRSAGGCERLAGAPNNGISSPRLTGVRVEDAKEGEAVARVTIRGTACAGEVVEIYQSFVTSGIRDKVPELPRIRSEKVDRETLTNDQREMALPSIGEFNYLGSTNAGADGTFEATFPLPVVTETEAASKSEEETKIWANQVLQGAAPADRAFAAIAIDAAGNTSEMSVRRQVD
jgi:Right handed beta helix region